MIDPAYAQLMARYNAWQNRSLYRAADGLSEEARRADRGAFFKSIHGTLSHLLWGDTVWMARFTGSAPPATGIRDSGSHAGDWAALSAARSEMDAAIEAFAAGLDAAGLAGDLTWHSAAAGRTVSKPRAFLIVHFFNHQTHHRGQVHAMLTAAGARPDDTDLFLIPEGA